jgi:ATP-binding cassette subfamily G (WHITE) protein 2 (PDR)
LASTVIGRGPTEDDEIENAGVVHALARELTRQNTRYASEGVPRNPFTSGKDEDPLLDPNSPDFSAVAWAKTLVHVQSRDPERYPRRTAGVAFRSLSVHGFGLPTDFQKDVGNIFLEGLGAVRSLLGLERKQKIQILRDYEGVLESGEMLVVLGRPVRYRLGTLSISFLWHC